MKKITSMGTGIFCLAIIVQLASCSSTTGPAATGVPVTFVASDGQITLDSQDVVGVVFVMDEYTTIELENYLNGETMPEPNSARVQPRALSAGIPAVPKFGILTVPKPGEGVEALLPEDRMRQLLLELGDRCTRLLGCVGVRPPYSIRRIDQRDSQVKGYVCSVNNEQYQTEEMCAKVCKPLRGVCNSLTEQ